MAEAPAGLKPIATAFVVIFVGEFGDLTQIQAANFSAKTHQPLEVFAQDRSLGKGAHERLELVLAIGIALSGERVVDPGPLAPMFDDARHTKNRQMPRDLWLRKTKGVLEICPRDQVFDGHSLLLVGFKDDANQPGGGLLLIRNSGGASRDGCITYAYAKAYMNDAAWIDAGGNSGQDRK